MFLVQAMDYMFFENDPDTNLKARALDALFIDPPKAWNWPLLDRYGLVQQLGDLILRTYPEDGFVDEGLLNLFRNEEPAYKEMVVEFLASFSFTEGPRDELFNKRHSIKFRLCERTVEMNLVQFGRVLGLVDYSVSKKAYRAHLDRATVMNPPTYTFYDSWFEVGMTTYDSQSCRESDLKSPVLRLLHRMLAYTVLFHKESEKVNTQHLKGMWYATHPECRWNLPHAMALMFQNAAKGKFGTLPCGQFVTTIARKLKFFGDHEEFACFRVDVARKEKSFLVSAMILKRLAKDSFRLYAEGEKKEEVTPRKRARSFGDASTSGTNEQATLDQMSRQMTNLTELVHKLGVYNDDLNSMFAQAMHVPMKPTWSTRLEASDGEEEETEDGDDAL